MLTHVHSLQAGWRGQEGFSHSAIAATALDSTKRLSRCSSAIIRAALSGVREEGREEMQRGRKTGREKRKACLVFLLLLNIQHSVFFGSEVCCCVLDSVPYFRGDIDSLLHSGFSLTSASTLTNTRVTLVFL